MDIKFKILEIYQQDKSVLVHFYTDELFAAIQPIWDSRASQLSIENPTWTSEQAMIQAQKEYVPGTILNITIYPDPAPTGAALIEYIYSHAPGDWLMTKSKAITTPNTILYNELETLRGQVYTQLITDKIAPIAMASTLPTPKTDFITQTVI